MINQILGQDKKLMEFHGMYRGIVMDVDDPLDSGRVRVRVYPMFKDVPVDHLPWAIYADNFMGGTRDVGSINVPVLESHVFVFFENGDYRFPVYFAGAPAIKDGIPDAPKKSRESDAILDSIVANTKSGVSTAGGGSWDEPTPSYTSVYPNNKVIQTSNGIQVELDDTDDNVRIHVYHPSGSRDEFDKDGNRIQHIEGTHYTVVIGDDNVYVSGNVNITTDGNANIKAGGDVNVENSGNSKIKSGGNVVVKGAIIQLN